MHGTTMVVSTKFSKRLKLFLFIVDGDNIRSSSTEYCLFDHCASRNATSLVYGRPTCMDGCTRVAG